MSIDNAIVFLVVLVCLVFVLRRFFGNNSGCAGCGNSCGCSGDDSSSCRSLADESQQ